LLVAFAQFTPAVLTSYGWQCNRGTKTSGYWKRGRNRRQSSTESKGPSASLSLCRLSDGPKRKRDLGSE